MSARPPLARRATDRLSDESITPPAPSAERVARTIEALEAALTARASRTRMRKKVTIVSIASGLAVAALGLVAVGRAWRNTEPGPARTDPAVTVTTVTTATTATTARPMVPEVPSSSVAPTEGVVVTARAIAGGVIVLHDGRALPPDAAASLDVGDRILAADGRAAVTLSTGTRLVAEAGADLTMTERGTTQAFELRAGSIHAEVAKLRPAERFLIRTADAEVEVRGTSFHVAIAKASQACGAGSLTRVTVSEGIVVVRAYGKEDRVGAGEAWPVGCAARKLAIAAAPSATSSDALRSDLVEQNRMFVVATAARRQGDIPRAIGLYERFMATYPSSALAESAAVERMRLLATSDPPRARDAAAEYLAHHPKGFARDEAVSISTKRP